MKTIKISIIYFFIIWVCSCNQKAKADVITNTLAESYNLGIIDVLQPDLVHMSDGVVVHTYSIEDVAT